MVGNIKKGMLAGSQMLTEPKVTWRQGIGEAIVGAVDKAAQAKQQFDEREKNLVWNRLDLEAANLQAEELENIRTAGSIDDVLAIKKDFESKIKANMDGQKWGKEWIEQKGSAYFTANQNDVAKAFRAKEKELATIELEKTMKSYVDSIANADPDRAALLLSQAGGLIETDAYLSPQEKHKTLESLTKSAIEGMASTNPEMAIKALEDKGRFANLSDVQRKEYKLKAENLLKARKNDAYTLQQRAKKQQQDAAEVALAKAKINYINGTITQEQALKDAEKYSEFAPKSASSFASFITNKKEDKLKSNPDVVKEIGDSILRDDFDKTKLISARINGDITKEDYNQYKTLATDAGKWKEEDEADEKALYEYLPKVKDLGKEGIENLFTDKKISSKVRTSLLNEYDAQEKDKGASVKLETANWKANIQQRISNGEDVDVDAEVDNAPYPDEARKELKELKDYQTSLANADESKKKELKKEAEAKAKETKKELEEQVKQVGANLLAVREKRQQTAYLDMDDTISKAQSISDLPSISDINNAVREDDISVDDASKLKTARATKEKELNGGATLSKGQKESNLGSYYDRYFSLRANSEATIDDYTNFYQDLNEVYKAGQLPDAEGQQFMQMVLPFIADGLNEKLEKQGDNHWFSSDEGIVALNDYIKEMDLKDKKEKGNQTEKKIIQEDNTRKARQRIRLYNMYQDNLAVVAREKGVNDVNLIPTSDVKSEVWSEALAKTKEQYLKQTYPNVDMAKINPTQILSSEGLQKVNTGYEDKGRGKPLADNRIVAVAKGKSGYKARFSDGSLKDIDEETYNFYKGKNNG